MLFESLSAMESLMDATTAPMSRSGSGGQMQERDIGGDESSRSRRLPVINLGCDGDHIYMVALSARK